MNESFAAPVTVVPRCGDTVLHRPTGDLLEVAWAYGDDFAWFGWPDGRARLSDCDLIERCSDEEHAKAVSQWLDVERRPDERGHRDSRAGMVRHLYRPEEERRLVREALNRDCQAIAERVRSHDAALAAALVAFGGAS